MIRTRLNQRRGAVALIAAGGLLTSAGLAGLGPLSATASSHREAPLIAGLPQYDTTDLYAFRSPERQRTVTLAASWLPFEEPAGGPNFYSFATDARYDIHVDNDGDAKADVTFRWTFKDHYRSKNTFLYATGEVTSLNDKNLNYYQTYRLVRIKDGKRTRVLVKSRKVAPSDVGEGSMPDYAKLRNQATTKIGKSVQSFAGQAEDSFFLDLRIFDLLYGGDFSETGDDTLAGFNVNSVALQVPRRWVAKNQNPGQNPIIGTWSTTSKKSVGGGYRQVSRLGMPLVNEVVLPLKVKDAFNASDPTQDGAALKYVTNPEVPRLIEKLYDMPAPETPRDDLVSVFLTGIKGLNKPKGVTPSEQLRLNMSTPVTANPNRLGVIGGDNQGYPNGRRLADDVLDISLQVLEGEIADDPNPNDLGDEVDTNDVAFSDTFPYLALPERGSEEDPHPTDVGNAPASAEGVTGLLQNETVSMSAVGVGMLALLMGSAGVARRSRRRES